MVTIPDQLLYRGGLDLDPEPKIVEAGAFSFDHLLAYRPLDDKGEPIEDELFIDTRYQLRPKNLVHPAQNSALN